VEAVNHLRRGAGMGNEQGRGESGCGHAEGDGELLCIVLAIELPLLVCGSVRSA